MFAKKFYFGVKLVMCGALGLAALLLISKTSLAQAPFPLPQWWGRSIVRTDPIEKAPDATQSLQSLIKDGKLSLTEEDAIRLVLENNLDVTVYRYNPRIAEMDIKGAARIFDPHFSFSGSAGETQSSQASLISIPNLTTVVQHAANFGYSQLFQTGTTFNIDYTNNRYSYNSILGRDINPYLYSTLTASLTQPLLRNFGRLPTDYLVRIARNNKKVSDLVFEQKIIQMINTVQNLYWELVFSREDIKVKQRSLDLAMKTHSDNQREVEIGTLAPIDLVKSETEIASRKQDLIVAQYTFEQSVNSIKKYLFAANDPSAIPATIEPLDTTLPPNTLKDFDLPPAVSTAVDTRTEVRQAQKQLENSDIQSRYSKNQLLPSLNLKFSYGGAAFSGTPDPSVDAAASSLPSALGFGNNLSNVFSGDNPIYSAGLTLDLPIRNRGAQADYARTLLLQRQYEKNLESVQQAVALEVRNAYTQLEMKRAQIDIAKQARQLQERTLDAEQKKFELGTSTIRFVLEEQRNLAQLQSNEIRAEVDFTKAKNQLDVATGKLLETHKVVIDDAMAQPGTKSAAAAGTQDK